MADTWYYREVADPAARVSVTHYYNTARQWMFSIVHRPQTLEMRNEDVVIGTSSGHSYSPEDAD